MRKALITLIVSLVIVGVGSNVFGGSFAPESEQAPEFFSMFMFGIGLISLSKIFRGSWKKEDALDSI